MNSYAAASLFVSVSFANKLGFFQITLEINASLASPDLYEGILRPAADAFASVRIQKLSSKLAKSCLQKTKCELVALFFCVIFISCSISLIFSRIPMMMYLSKSQNHKNQKNIMDDRTQNFEISWRVFEGFV